ncbi:oligosaccharide flippase family protein [Gottfriedia sp. NPDC057991]|uniref:oligosaccharide flippase family protein n=1 Tax=Gottfriedia sp. NPDC057991 TaxID=3346298 RepID=UPI0036DA7DAA
MGKLASNYLFNVLYQFLVMALPLISTPYVARVLNPEGLGVSSYSTSVVQVFVFFSILGIQVYGNRQIASIKHKGLIELSKEFWSIYSVQFLSSMLTVISYLLIINNFVEVNKKIFYIQSIVLIGSLLDISWLFIGLEELKKIVLRNTVVKIVSLLLIFICVKQPEDLYLYILINVFGNLIGQVVMWLQVPKYIKLTSINTDKIKTHIKPIFSLFLPLLFVQIYSVYNKVLLGALVSNKDVGYYDQALKIIQLTLAIVTSLTSVMLPRISSEFAKGNLDNVNYYVNNILRFVLFLTIPMCIGLISISPKLIPWFLGPGYSEVINLLMLMSPIIIFIGCANVFAMQILIPTHQQGKYTISVAIAGTLSLITNIILVKPFGNIGTGIAILVAEGVGAFIQALFVKNYFDFRLVITYSYKYILSASLVGGISFSIGELVNTGGIFITLTQIFVSIIVYLSILLLLKDDLILTLFGKVTKFVVDLKIKKFKSNI